MDKVKFRYRTLKLWREDRGWSQVEAAEYLGMTQSMYSRLERGTHPAWGKRAKVVHEKTGVPVDVLAGAA